ncbi:hypothetical protein VPH35_110848 [Triticum aestivum]|uniref:Complex III subunit VI n=1 Tax=Aegilops tauschii TaxID=37682 RepID=M8C6R5_AEGTA
MSCRRCSSLESPRHLQDSPSLASDTILNWEELTSSLSLYCTGGADEEVSDPKALLEDRTKAKCVYQWYEYQKCVKRIEGDETGQKHCTGQYFDYWKCIDKHVAEKLFDSLK